MLKSGAFRLRGDFSPRDRLWEERIPRLGWPNPSPIRLPRRGSVLSPPGCHPSFLRITVLPAKITPPTQQPNDDDNNRLVLFEQSQSRLSARPRCRSGAGTEGGRAARPNPGAGVPGVVAFALSGAFWRASEAGGDAVTAQRSPCVYRHPSSFAHWHGSAGSR